LGPTQPSQQQQQQSNQNQATSQNQQQNTQGGNSQQGQNQNPNQQSQQSQNTNQQQNTVITIPGTNNTIQIPANFAGKNSFLAEKGLNLIDILLISLVHGFYTHFLFSI
jgi:hypothetical protein